MLEHRSVEFAARIPDAVKISKRRLKHILRQVAARHLPPEIVGREKQGFGFPLAYWMRQPLRPVLEEALKTSRFVERGVFEPTYLTRILEEHATGRRDHNFRLWIFLSLELWHRQFVEGSSVQEMVEWLSRSADQAAA